MSDIDYNKYGLVPVVEDKKEEVKEPSIDYNKYGLVPDDESEEAQLPIESEAPMTPEELEGSGRGYSVAPVMADTTTRAAQEALGFVGEKAAKIGDFGEVYEFAKQGKSIYDPKLKDEFLGAVKNTSKNYMESYAKIFKDVGKQLGEQRKIAKSLGKKYDPSEQLKNIEDMLIQQKNAAGFDLEDAKKVDNLIEENLKSLKNEFQIGKRITPADPKINEANRKRLNDLLLENEYIKSLSGIETKRLPISQVGGSYISGLEDVPKQITKSKWTSVVGKEEDLQDKLDIFKQRKNIEGVGTNYLDSISAGGKEIVPTEITSSKLTPDTKSIFKVPYAPEIPTTTPIMDSKFKTSMDPVELYRTRKTLYNQLNKLAVDDELRGELLKQIQVLNDMETDISPEMKGLKEVYRQGKLITSDTPGLESVTSKGVPDLAAGAGSPKQLKKEILNASQRVFSEVGGSGDLVSSTLADTENELSKMIDKLKTLNPEKYKDLTPPSLAKELQSMDEVSRRQFLKAGTIGEESIEAYAAASAAQGDVLSSLKRIPKATADALGKGVSKIPQSIRTGTKVGGKILGRVGLPLLAGYMTYDEAIDEGLTPEDAMAYTAAITGVDYAAMGAGAVAGSVVPVAGTAVGATIGMGLPIVREVDKLINPEKQKNLLKMFKYLKQQGKSTAEATTEVVKRQTADTVSSPYNLIKNTFGGNLLSNKPEEFLNIIRTEPRYSAYLPQIEKLSEMDYDERARSMAIMEQDPAFRKMMKDIENKDRAESSSKLLDNTFRRR
jgi:hypothetical protein